ncbi:MAG: class I SAM-dependent methyltransferase [Patescibacteria group bacterium]
MIQNKYLGYFKKHYHAKFSAEDIESSQKWLYPQWKLIKEKTTLSKKSKVLEIGAGFGGFYSYLSQVIEGNSYTGIELDKEVVKFCKDFFKTGNFTNISIERFNSKNKFNYIFAFEVLEHLNDPFETIGKIHSLLDKTGVFVGTSPYPYLKNVFADRTHRYVLHPVNWTKLFIEAGFKHVSIYPMSFIPFIWRLNKHLNFRIPFYIPFNGFISTALIIASK